MKLSELKKGESAKIAFIDLPETERDRLNRTGLTKGVEITLIRRAPFNGPLEFRTRDFYLALRVSQAERIEVSTDKTENTEKRQPTVATESRKRGQSAVDTERQIGERSAVDTGKRKCGGERQSEL